MNERDEARVIRNPTATVSGDLFALTLDFFRFAFETLSVIFAFLCTEAKNWSLLIQGPVHLQGLSDMDCRPVCGVQSAVRW